MYVLVIRHAHAAPATASTPDAERPLTAEGERRFREASAGLARLVRPDVLLTSPLRRARQTADIAAEAWNLEARAERTVASGTVDQILELLGNHPPDATVALVGHEPTVSTLVAQLTGAMSSEEVAFEPGAAALLQVPAATMYGARLVWFLSPSAAAAAAATDGREAP